MIGNRGRAARRVCPWRHGFAFGGKLTFSATGRGCEVVSGTRLASCPGGVSVPKVRLCLTKLLIGREGGEGGEQPADDEQDASNRDDRTQPALAGEC